MIYFTADPHFGHKAIIEYCNRPFKDVQHMEDELVERWNRRVGPTDTVFVLGDFFLGGRMLFEALMARLQGTKHLVMGNHDRSSATWYVRHGFKSAQKGRLWFMHPDAGLLPVVLSHSPMLPDEIKKTGVVNLHGHVHGKWKRRGGNINVGVDVRDFEPKTLTELLAEGLA